MDKITDSPDNMHALGLFHATLRNRFENLEPLKLCAFPEYDTCFFEKNRNMLSHVYVNTWSCHLDTNLNKSNKSFKFVVR